ncbi:N-acetyl-D-Glu racemase DgcA [Photobacterium sp. DNB23_23_1]
MKLNIVKQRWPIRGAFTISRGSKTEVNTLIVELEHQGSTGRGECVPYARYGESLDSVEAQLRSIASQVEEGASRLDMQKLLPPGAARNAIDCAFWDLECKQQHCSIWQNLGCVPDALETAFTLSLDTPEKMQQMAADNAFRPLLKLKLGGEDDLQRVKAVRRGAPSSKLIIDANEAWDIESYERVVPELFKLGVAMIEQPFPADKDHWLDEVARPIPICADESCHDRTCLAMLVDRFDMINIKIDKTGGLTEALALKQEAERMGLAVMVGCMLSSSLSMAPAFVAAQGADIVDLDGPLLLSQDIEHGFEFKDNQMLPFGTELWG